MALEKNQKRWLVSGIMIATLLFGGIIYRYNWWTFVDSYEQGYLFDKTTGKITVLQRTGWHRITPFFTEINTIDTRPMQIRIEANNRVLNAMLVRFKKEGLQQFIDLHGRGNYGQDGAGGQTSLAEILKSYAYEGYGSNQYNKELLQKKYKFMEIMGGTSGTSAEIQNYTVTDSVKIVR